MAWNSACIGVHPRFCGGRQEVLSPINDAWVAVFGRGRVFRQVYLPDKPGLGVTLNGACVQKCQVKSAR